MEIRGIDLVELTKEYGTPLFIFDETRLRENYQNFFHAFKQNYPAVIVCYSIKTNYNPTICRIFQQEGSYAEVGSGLDLYVARKAGFTPERIIYDGVYKSDEELHEALKEGVLNVNVESFSELKRLDKIAEKIDLKQAVGIRINLYNIPKNPISKFFNYESLFCYSTMRFGFSPEEAYLVCREALKMKNLQFVGLMTHPYHGAIKPMLTFAERIMDDFGIKVRYINLGGGFSVPTVHSVTPFDLVKNSFKERLGIRTSLDKKEKVQGIAEIAKSITATIKLEASKDLLSDLTLVLEPGRYLVGSAGLLLLRVVDVKTVGGYKWIITDGGTNIFTGYSERREILVANRASSTSDEVVNVMGRLLHAHDFITIKQRLPRLQEGDIIAVLDVGAYCMSRSNQFLYPRPYVILISQDGRPLVIRRGEAYKDVLHMDEDIFGEKLAIE